MSRPCLYTYGEDGAIYVWYRCEDGEIHVYLAPIDKGAAALCGVASEYVVDHSLTDDVSPTGSPLAPDACKGCLKGLSRYEELADDEYTSRTGDSPRRP